MGNSDIPPVKLDQAQAGVGATRKQEAVTLAHMTRKHGKEVASPFSLEYLKTTSTTFHRDSEEQSLLSGAAPTVPLQPLPPHRTAFGICWL